MKLFSNFFFQNFFLKIENMFETIFLFFLYFLSIYLYIYWNPKFHIPKTLPHPSLLNPKSRLVNPRGTKIFYPSLKVRVKLISVNMKSGITNVVFVAIFHYIVYYKFYISRYKTKFLIWKYNLLNIVYLIF